MQGKGGRGGGKSSSPKFALHESQGKTAVDSLAMESKFKMVVGSGQAQGLPLVIRKLPVVIRDSVPLCKTLNPCKREQDRALCKILCVA
jgi:hypothetical protein